MGEAARRKKGISELKNRNEAWLASLSLGEERIIAEVAQTTYDKIVSIMGMTEGCYNLAFFLHEHLRRKHDVHLDIIVGWINDGEWDGAASHAWVEYHGKKIDISAHMTSHPEIQLSGDLIILDHVVKQGMVSYTYWPILPNAAAEVLERMGRENLDLAAVIAHKGKEHQRISELAKTPQGVATYFSQAPSNINYDALARVVG
ncbi:MAG: hypothetical protein P4L87_20655 [Formivibrio sp.]|nr:hypothetical protein [Formivibrio sp.]